MNEKLMRHKVSYFKRAEGELCGKSLSHIENESLYFIQCSLII